MSNPSRRNPRSDQPLVQRVFYRWGSAEILQLLRESGDMRFSEICRHLPALSEQIVSARLGDLREIGMIQREVGPETPPSVTYSLTDLGRKLAKVAEAIQEISQSDQIPVQAA